MRYANEYLENLGGILEKIKENEEQYLEAAAAILARIGKYKDVIKCFGPK